jgi:hypothetical protein
MVVGMEESLAILGCDVKVFFMEQEGLGPY